MMATKTIDSAQDELLHILRDWEQGALNSWDVRDAAEAIEDELRASGLLLPGHDRGAAALVDVALGILANGDLELLLLRDIPRIRTMLCTPSEKADAAAQLFLSDWKCSYDEPDREGDSNKLWYGTDNPVA